MLNESDATPLAEVPRNSKMADSGRKQLINNAVTSSYAAPEAGLDEDLFSLAERWCMHFLN